MNDIHTAVMRIVGQQTAIDDALRAIFVKYFEIKEDSNPGYRAYAEYAAEVGVALANIIISVRKPEAGRGLRAISDLTYALNANEFWLKNAPVLVPVLTIVLNAHRDYIDMQMRRSELSEYAAYDKMMSAANGAPLEMFAMLLYLVGGPTLMGVSSLALKQELAPYFLN